MEEDMGLDAANPPKEVWLTLVLISELVPFDKVLNLLYFSSAELAEEGQTDR